MVAEMANLLAQYAHEPNHHKCIIIYLYVLTTKTAIFCVFYKKMQGHILSIQSINLFTD